MAKKNWMKKTLAMTMAVALVFGTTAMSASARSGGQQGSGTEYIAIRDQNGNEFVIASSSSDKFIASGTYNTSDVEFTVNEDGSVNYKVGNASGTSSALQDKVQDGYTISGITYDPSSSVNTGKDRYDNAIFSGSIILKDKDGNEVPGKVDEGGNIIPDPDPLPTDSPDPEPTDSPDPEPTDNPDPEPTDNPDPEPIDNPDPEPTDNPDPEPTDNPDPEPTDNPDPEPTDNPDPEPTDNPDPEPTDNPDPEPTDNPDPEPTDEPDVPPYIPPYVPPYIPPYIPPVVPPVTPEPEPEPEPVVEEPVVDEPVVEIPEEEPPLADLPDEETPLADVPQTGSALALYAALTVLSGGGLLWMGLKNKDEE